MSDSRPAIAAGIARSTILEGAGARARRPGHEVRSRGRAGVRTAPPRRTEAGACTGAGPGRRAAFDVGRLGVANADSAARKARFLRETHAAACRIFGTVLGPEANNAHRNHFHVDLAERNSGSFCE